MHRRHLPIAGLLFAIASIATAPGVSARTLVDPTSLTPPLEPYRICYQTGLKVQCDTSSDTSYHNQAAFELPCGMVYESATERRHATRWYQDGLLVERIVQSHLVGSWSLSPTGAGITVGFAADQSWDETFLIPGDLTSDSEVSHGNFMRVQGGGSAFRDVGLYRADGTRVGLHTFTEDVFPKLCALLT